MNRAERHAGKEQIGRLGNTKVHRELSALTRQLTLDQRLHEWYQESHVHKEVKALEAGGKDAPSSGMFYIANETGIRDSIS